MMQVFCLEVVLHHFSPHVAQKRKAKNWPFVILVAVIVSPTGLEAEGRVVGYSLGCNLRLCS